MTHFVPDVSRVDYRNRDMKSQSERPVTPTVVDAFATAVGTDPTRPLVTFYDDATGERVELSGATLANWVAKTANLLVDGHGLGAGDIAAVRLPPHWLSAAVLLGCWSAGLAVDLAGVETIGGENTDTQRTGEEDTGAAVA